MQYYYDYIMMNGTTGENERENWFPCWGAEFLVGIMANISFKPVYVSVLHFQNIPGMVLLPTNLHPQIIIHGIIIVTILN